MDWMLIVACLALAVTLAVDLEQTMIIAASPNHHELNPILGPKPSVIKVWIYFLLVYAALGGTVLVLQPIAPMAVTVLMTIFAVVELWVIVRNHYIGIHVFKNW